MSDKRKLSAPGDTGFHDPILKGGDKKWNASKAQMDSAKRLAALLNEPVHKVLPLVTR